MEHALNTIEKSLKENEFISCTFSGQRLKSNELKSIHIIQTKESDTLKVEYRLSKHNDIKSIQVNEFIADKLNECLTQFKQCFLKTNSAEYQILINKKLKAKIIKKDILKESKKNNRTKNYLIPDNQICPFLIEVGIMSKTGQVKPNYYKKFKQINRFLEMVDDLFKSSSKKNYHLVDFGCGKSYLTFALYHYFTEIKKAQVKITGIDLKQEVINHCNSIARKLNYTGLNFVHGFIHDFNTDEAIDFVVTLHACDTATDDAILFSLDHNAEKMMFVPCCQHELNKQIENSSSSIMLKHGIFKDRMTALVTDTMRSQLLESCGYKVQSMEFIDLEHTAKNILLRCEKVSRPEKENLKAHQMYNEFKEQWNITPYLEMQLMSRDLIN